MIVGELFSALTEVACELTVDVLKNFNNYTHEKQNDALSTHCTKITKANGLVTFEDAYDLYNKYRAYTPWPGIYLESGLKLKKVELVEKCTQNTAGEILAIEEDHIVVACSKGSIKIYSVQPQSKKEMDVLAYINGKRLNIENTLS